MKCKQDDSVYEHQKCKCCLNGIIYGQKFQEQRLQCISELKWVLTKYKSFHAFDQCNLMSENLTVFYACLDTRQTEVWC